MKTIRLTVLGITGALLLGSAVVQAEETDAAVNQRNQVWSMQGERDGSYTGTPLQTQEQKRIQTRTREQKRIQTRTRAQPYGDGQGSRYGQGYESRGSYGPGQGGYSSGAGGAGRSGGQGGGRR